ncbi:hypothetical protein OROMI_008452 [Orobanche minor]
MSASETSSLSLRKKDMIINGRIFARSAREYISEDNDRVGMNLFVSRVKQASLYRLGSLHPENYDVQIVEEFFLDADFLYASDKKGSDLTVAVSTVQEKEISIQELLERLYKFPSDSLVENKIQRK